MKSFQEYLAESKRETEFLEISITSVKENGYPVSTNMKHRLSKNGRWIGDSDLDSGEQGGIKDLPRKVQELFEAFCGKPI